MSRYESDQPSERRSQRFTDQHGRKWSGVIEIKSGIPTGALRPLDFKAPLQVPQEFIRYDKLEPNSVRIDYAEWIASLEEARRQWDRKLVSRAQKLFGEDAGKNIKNPPPQLLQAVGPEPKPVEPVQAAAAGNNWVLGLTPIKPKWAKKFFPDEDKKKSLVGAREVSTGTIDPDTADEWKKQFPDDDKVDKEE